MWNKFTHYCHCGGFFLFFFIDAALRHHAETLKILFSPHLPCCPPGFSDAYAWNNTPTHLICKHLSLIPLKVTCFFDWSSYLQPSGQRGFHMVLVYSIWDNKHPWKALWLRESHNILQTALFTAVSMVSTFTFMLLLRPYDSQIFLIFLHKLHGEDMLKYLWTWQPYSLCLGVQSKLPW